jgi:proteasome assembly chaperone (PAC2) family protein
MIPAELNLLTRPPLQQPSLVMGFSGWMDGGDVSTGTVNLLVDALEADRLAAIDPHPFYIYNFPGSMEVSALFRPHVRMEDGRLVELDFPENVFHYSLAHNLVLFSGKEPNINWPQYVRCIFTVCEEFDVQRIYFIGSVAGTVPHTREPRLSSSVSDPQMREALQRIGVRFSDYEGPASLVNMMIEQAPQRNVQMATLVAEIPAYVQGTNPRCIESVTRRLAGLLGIQVQLDELRDVSDEFERKLSEVVKDRDDLEELIGKLEADYDNEIFDSQMGDLKDWLQQRGIRLD